jgi:hypothetical protein
MQTHLLNKRKLAALLLVIASLFSAGLYHGEALAAPAPLSNVRTEAAAALPAILPATTCSLSGTTRTCDLWAKTGSTTLPGGATAPVWGYTDSVGGTVTSPGGPMLIVNQGETVVVNLNNTLTEAISLLFQGQAMVPDTVGAAAIVGTTPGTKTYTFTAANPGTFLYEAGLLPNAEHQAAMGLYGALIVRPATAGQAYGDPATAFNDEAVLVLSEIDPALNANPAAFDMRNYAPKYFLINGKAYPATDTIPSTAGNKVLLRYVNAGVQQHSMGLLGLRQNFVAKDASLLPTLSHNVAAESLAPGQTGDAIATVPVAATNASKFAVYDGNLMLHNNNAAGFGGMLTFVTAGTGSAVTGPTTSAVALTPNPTNGSVIVALSASIASASSTVAAAEYFIDTTGTAGTGTLMGGTFGSATVSVNATLSTVQLAALASGNHTIYVHGRDAAGAWGAFSSAVLNLDKAGPVTSGLTLTPNPSSGTVAVALHATGNDSATGGSNITAAEYFRGTTPPATTRGTAMTVNIAAPVASLDATIPCTTASPCVGGAINVRSQDALGNWGAFATITLNVVAAGPVTSNVVAAPNPNNGALPLNSSQPVVRVTATMASAGSTVSAAEGFIDAVGATGTGFPFVPSDGVWNSATEIGTSDIPLATINALSAGNHTIYVRGKDAAGNWGATNTTILVIDKTAPTITNVTLTPSTMVFATASTLLTVSATDTGTGVSGGQYWIDGTATPPANATAFAGTTATINTSAVAAGNHTVYVRVQDAATNWSSVSSTTLTVIQAVNDTRTITANTSATQTSDANATAGVLVNDQPVGVAGRTATLASAPVRTSGTGAGTITLSCPGALGTAATPAISGNTVCTNGAYRVTLNGVGTSGNARRSSKLGTYQFTYTETLNGVTTPPATVTITVN